MGKFTGFGLLSLLAGEPGKARSHQNRLFLFDGGAEVDVPSQRLAPALEIVAMHRVVAGRSDRFTIFRFLRFLPTEVRVTDIQPCRPSARDDLWLAVMRMTTLKLSLRLSSTVKRENTGEADTIKPWDPKQIRITTKNFTVREVYTQIMSNDLDLAPDFQRSFVWDERRQVRLIESILLGIPLPAFYFNQDSQGEFQVIDGVQRLTTIRLFMSNKLSLNDTHLEYLKDLQNMNYETLDAPVRRRFAGTQIVAHVIEPQTPDEVKYDIFNRVNTGGSPLTAQEIRHCMSKTRSRALLRSLVERNSFDKATDFTFWAKSAEGEWIRDNHRMADREMALRFCAFGSTPLTEYARAVSLDSFLLEYTRRIDRGDIDDQELNRMEASFERSMANCAAILGNGAFRRWAPGAVRRGPINRAIFESQALALADYDIDVLLPYKEQIVAAFRELFDDQSYDSAVRSSTGDPRRIERRLKAPRDRLTEIIL